MDGTVVLTGSSGSLPGLGSLLRSIPVQVEEHPLLSFGEPEDWSPVDRALGSAHEYRAIAFTSPRSAEAVVSRIRTAGLSWPEAESGPAVWAGGVATETALKGVLGPVRRPGDSAVAGLGAAVALARAILEAQTGSPVLFPCGEVRREELTRLLRQGGLRVDEAVCYRTLLAGEREARAAAARATVLVVASPRVAELLARACPPGNRPHLVAVGPTTTKSARAAGWAAAAAAALPAAESVARAVRQVLAQPGR